MLGQRLSSITGDITVSSEITSEDNTYLEELVPPQIDKVFNEATGRFDAMEGEGPEWSQYAVSAQTTMNSFLESAPGGLGFADATNCTGAGVTAGTGGVTYSVARTVGPDPAELRPDVLKREGDSESKVGQITGPGRMNGKFGWSKDKNLIVGALASYEHNFVSSILGYFERPSLPFSPDNSGWKLPNLVLNETEDPDQFHPTGSFAYSTRPSLYKQFNVQMQVPQKSKVGIDLWDSSKSSISRIEEQEIPKGTTTLTITTVGFGNDSGYLNINPLDAPEGLTITNVQSVPRAI
jgi:hypothetical protein